jgi:hypothetical protein
MQTKIIDELFLIFFINYFMIICFFNLDFFHIIYDLFQSNLSNSNNILLIGLFFFFAVPKKKTTGKKKLISNEQIYKIFKKVIINPREIQENTRKTKILNLFENINNNNLKIENDQKENYDHNTTPIKNN